MEQIRLSDGLFAPVTTGDIDLGDGAVKFKNLFLSGAISVGSTVDGRDIADDGVSLDSVVSKLAGIEALADVTDSTNVDAAGATMNTDTDVSGTSWVLDEDDLVSDSATQLATQQSIKAYVDNITFPLVDEDDLVSDSATTSPSQQSVKAYVDTNLALTTLNADTDVSSNSWVLDEDTLVSDSATKVPTQQSVKAYVDSSTLADSGWLDLTYSGTWETDGTYAFEDSRYRKVGNIIYLEIAVRNSSSTFGIEFTSFGTLPSGYRPSNIVVCGGSNTSAQTETSFHIGTDGTIVGFSSPNKTGMAFSTSFVVA